MKSSYLNAFLLFLRAMNSRTTIAVVAIFLAALTGCNLDNGSEPQENVIDTHSFARPDEASTLHLDLHLDVDF